MAPHKATQLVLNRDEVVFQRRELAAHDVCVWPLDPRKKLVNWIPALCTSTKLDLIHIVPSPHEPATISAPTENIFTTKSGVQVNGVDIPESLLSNKGLQARLRDINDAELCLRRSVEVSMDAKQFTSNLQSLLQEGFVKKMEEYLAEGMLRESQLREVFVIDGAHVTKTSTERLSSLARVMTAIGGPKVPGTQFTTGMINEGIELELNTLQLVEEIRQATIHEQKMGQLKEAHVESTRKLVEKLVTEMMEHLKRIRTESERTLKERMLSRRKLTKCLRQTEEEVSVLTMFCAILGTREIAERVHSDALKDRDQKLKEAEQAHEAALKDRDQQHAREKDAQTQKLNTANEVHKTVVCSLLASLKELRDAQPSQECCVCLGELEGFSLISQSSMSKKLVHKRACFLPCMHAIVCTSCSEKRWKDGPRVCPLCRQKLTEKPRTIFL